MNRKDTKHLGTSDKKCTFAIELLGVAKRSISVNLHFR